MQILQDITLAFILPTHWILVLHMVFKHHQKWALSINPEVSSEHYLVWPNPRIIIKELINFIQVDFGEFSILLLSKGVRCVIEHTLLTHPRHVWCVFDTHGIYETNTIIKYTENKIYIWTVYMIWVYLKLWHVWIYCEHFHISMKKLREKQFYLNLFTYLKLIEYIKSNCSVICMLQCYTF